MPRRKDRHVGDGRGYPSDYARHGVWEDVVCDGREYTPEEVEFLVAADKYRRAHGLNFLSLTEALGVLKGLGYRKG